MRTALFTLLAAAGCSFTPGALPTDAPPGTPIDARIDAPMIDMQVVKMDAPDAFDPPGFVRSLDVLDTSVTGGPHADFPVLVSLTASWLATTANAGNVVSPLGNDIYFTSDLAGTTRLAHEIESYLPTGSLVAWVKVPQLSAQTVIYMHYGDPALAGTNTQSVNAVWSSYAFVAHMHGGGDASGNSPSVTGFFTNAMGKFGPARSFDGVDNYILATAPNAMDDVFVGGGTAEAWFLADTYGETSRGRMLDKGDENGWILYVNDAEANSAVTFWHGSVGGTAGTWFSPAVTVGVWHHALVVYNKDAVGNDPVIYIDGAVVDITEFNTPSTTMDSEALAELYIGNRDSLDRAWDGLLDELRVSTNPRTAGWVATQYQNQNDPAFFTVSAPL